MVTIPNDASVTISGNRVTYTTSNSNGSVTVRNENVTTFISASGRIDRSIERTVSSAGLTGVRIHTPVGELAIESAADPGRLNIHADITLGDGRQLPALDRKRYIAGFTVGARNSAGTLEIEAIPPPDLPHTIGFAAAFRVGVPANLSLDLRTSNGGIRVENTGAKGEITAESDSGDIEIRNVGSHIEAHSSNGSVSVQSLHAIENVRATSDSGSVTVDGPIRIVDARSSNGDVSVSHDPAADRVDATSDSGEVEVRGCGGAVHARSSNGNVTYRADGAKPQSLDGASDSGDVDATIDASPSLSLVELHSSNGSVTLQAPASGSYQISAHTSNGDVHASGFKGQYSGEDSDKTFTGVSHGGHIPVRLSSDSGDVSIRGN